MDHPSYFLSNLFIGEAWLTPLPYIYISLIIILVFLSAFFSMTETAFACVNQFKIKVLADEGNKKAKKIIKLYESFNETLTMSLIGHNLVNVILSTISTVLFLLFFVNILDDTVISLISTAVMTLITYIFGDMVPKMIARKNPDKVAFSTINIFLVFYYLFFPLVWIFSLLIRLFNKIFHADDIPQVTEEDFTNIVESIEEKGLIEENESDIITASLDFTDTSVRDILTKRNRMFVIDLKKLSKEEINEVILSTNYSRIPVCYGSLDKIIGVLIVKSYIKAYLNNPTISVLSILQKPYFVSTRIKLDDLMEGFKKNHTHIAIVKKDDVVVGMVTMEDVLEELVGKIAEPLAKQKEVKR